MLHRVIAPPAQNVPRSASPGAASAADRSAALYECAAVTLAGLLVAVVVHAHYDKPHGDFYDFREMGRELLSGQAPQSYKRAPLFPLLVAAVGSLLEHFPAGRPADQRAAELINALLLPVNALLVHLVARRWMPRGAPWAAAWFLLLPLGLYSTAHTLVEPLLVCTTLLTVLAAQHRHWTAYAFATAACMTRYDMAGLIAGVALADMLAGRGWRRIVTGVVVSTAPLAVWLALTAVTWEARGREHYIEQLLERPGFDPGWSWRMAWQCATAPDLRLPLVLADVRGPLHWLIQTALAICLTAGILWLPAGRDWGGAALLCGLAGYWLVHAAFPFREERFGYPPAPLLILLGGAGGAALVARVREALAPVVRKPQAGPRGERNASRPGGAARRAAIILAGVCVVLSPVVIFAEVQGLRNLLSARPAWNRALPPACVGAVLLIGLPGLRRGRRGEGALASLALAALALGQARLALPLLGSRAEQHGSVLAAQWIRDHAQPDQRVVANVPGLLRMYAGAVRSDRFLGFDELRGATWPELLAEFRERRIAYVVWHDDMFGEHGDYYARRWRLERFEPLSEPGLAPGVSVAADFPGRPHVWVLRVGDD